MTLDGRRGGGREATATKFTLKLSQLLLLVSHKFKFSAANLKRQTVRRFRVYKNQASQKHHRGCSAHKQHHTPRQRRQGPLPGGPAEGVVAPTPPLSGLSDCFSGEGRFLHAPNRSRGNPTGQFKAGGSREATVTRSQCTPTSGLSQALTSEILGEGAERPLDNSVKTLSLRQASGTGVQGCPARAEPCALTISGMGAVLTPPGKGQEP